MLSHFLHTKSVKLPQLAISHINIQNSILKYSTNFCKLIELTQKHKQRKKNHVERFVCAPTTRKCVRDVLLSISKLICHGISNSLFFFFHISLYLLLQLFVSSLTVVGSTCHNHTDLNASGFFYYFVLFCSIQSRLFFFFFFSC